MKLTIILPGTGVTGGARVVYEYANRLDSWGHDVTILYPIIPPRYAHSLFDPVITKEKFFGAIKRIFNQDIGWFDLSVDVKAIPCLNPRLVPLLNSFIPSADITIATSWQTSHLVSALNEYVGKKCYFIQHYEIWPLWNDLDCWEQASDLHSDPSIGMFHVEPDDSYTRNYKHRVDESYQLPLYKIVTSNWEREVMEEMGLSIDAKITLGVNMDQFYPAEVEKTRNITLVALYRNKPYKGDDEAIKAFKIIGERYPNVRLEMFGLSKPANLPEFVNFHKNPQQDELRKIYSRGDLLIFPSWVEGYGMPPMEAMACRTGLVSTDVGAVREYTPEDGVKFVPIQDHEAIVDEVEYLIKHPEEVQQMKESCYEHIQRFNWKRSAKEFEEALKTIINPQA